MREGRAAARFGSAMAIVLTLLGRVDAQAGVMGYAEIVSTATTPGGRGCSSFGSGMAVGEGLVLTADHVVLDRADLTPACHLSDRAARRPDVVFRVTARLGRSAARAAKVVARGLRTNAPAMSFASSSDFAILRVAGVPGGRLEPCTSPPMSGLPVIVLLRSGAVSTTIAESQTPKRGDDARYIDLDHVFEHGASGAGVLDAATLCVLGVISHRFPEPAPRVTRMTPIAVFAAAWQTALSR